MKKAEKTRQLYDLYANSQNPVAAAKVMDSYQEALLSFGDSSTEINSKGFAFCFWR
jgi:hypothetical protein